MNCCIDMELAITLFSDKFDHKYGKNCNSIKQYFYIKTYYSKCSRPIFELMRNEGFLVLY